MEGTPGREGLGRDRQVKIIPPWYISKVEKITSISLSPQQSRSECSPWRGWCLKASAAVKLSTDQKIIRYPLGTNLLSMMPEVLGPP